jgi:DNA-binding XRE family transcriptional regulator
MTGQPVRKYAQVAAMVRAQVADGTLKAGQSAPSGDALSRLTGFSALTCRKALRALIAEGILSPGATPSARPRVAVGDAPQIGDAALRLSRALAHLRRFHGLTQPALAAVTGYSVTTIGHAETGRLWQSRDFWEKTDIALSAGHELTSLYDAYRAETAGPVDPAAQPVTLPPPALAGLTLHWSDGTTTDVDPSALPLAVTKR